MPPPSYTSPYPSLDLSLDEKEHLLHVTDEQIDQVKQRFEDFLWRDNGRIDSELWNLVKQREDVRVYYDRRPGAGTGNRHMHQLLTTGTIVSTLSDAMYGELNYTTEAMRVKSAYIGDTFLDCAVLETILEPTLDDPFQSTTLKWFVKGMPMAVRAVSKHCDNVLLESTGMRQLSNGERVGFRLWHSVAFATTPPLPNYERVNVSICALWREKTPTTVEIFTTTFLQMGDSIMLPFVIKSSADALLSVRNMATIARMKKLAWLVEHKTTLARLADCDHPSKGAEGCSVCGSTGRSTRKGIKSACAICSSCTCESCRVKMELLIYAPDGQLVKHPTRFCLHCLTVANKLDAAVVARDQVLAKSDYKSDLGEPRAAWVRQAMGGGVPSLSKSSDGSRGIAYCDDYHNTWSSSSSAEQ